MRNVKENSLFYRDEHMLFLLHKAYVPLSQNGILQNLTLYVLTPLFDLPLQIRIEIKDGCCYLFLCRRKRKMSIGAKRRDSSFNRSRDTTDNNVYEQDYGCIVNTAFDQDESAHDTNL